MDHEQRKAYRIQASSLIQRPQDNDKPASTSRPVPIYPEAPQGNGVQTKC
jgi:hypothetical protein